MMRKLLINILFWVILLALPTFSSASFFDDLGEKIEKEAKRTETRIKKEMDRADENVDKITQKTKDEAEEIWDEHKDEIVPIVVTATVLYVGDINLATLALKEYGLTDQYGTIDWDTLFADKDKSPQLDQVNRAKIIVYVRDNNMSDPSKSGVMVINRTFPLSDGEKSSQVWIQIVEDEKMFIAGGWENSQTGMIDIIATDIKPGSVLSQGPAHKSNMESYIGHEQLSYIKIAEPEGISKQEWHKIMKNAALAYQTKNDEKRKYAFGSSYAVIKQILESVQPELSQAIEVFDPINEKRK